jgi:hypothetical protein
MKTSRPLVCGEFSLQNLLIDHDDLLDFFDVLDYIITDPIVNVVRKFEVDREVTIELWRKEPFLTRNRSRTNMRLANLFEVCAFANRFSMAHIEYGDYCGFDSVAGKIASNCYCPVVCDVGTGGGSALYLCNPKRDELPDHCLVVTKENLL